MSEENYLIQTLKVANGDIYRTWRIFYQVKGESGAVNDHMALTPCEGKVEEVIRFFELKYGENFRFLKVDETISYITFDQNKTLFKITYYQWGGGRYGK